MKNNLLNFSKSWLTLVGLGYLPLSIVRKLKQWISESPGLGVAFQTRKNSTFSCIGFLYATAKELAKEWLKELPLKSAVQRKLLQLLQSPVKLQFGLTFNSVNNFYSLKLN